MKDLKNIPTLKDDGFKTIMSYYDSNEYNKKNIKDFYIHGLSDDTYVIKMPLQAHRQTKHSIILVTNGSLVASSGFDNYNIERDTMIVVPAGHITSLSYMSPNVEGYYLHFTDEYLSHIKINLSNWLLRPVIKFSVEELGHLVPLLKRMQQLNENVANADIIKLYLTTFLAEMGQSSDFHLRMSVPAHERITMEFKQLINNNTIKHKSVSFYAEQLNVTANHLNKSVKTTLGKPASELIDEMLILEVKILMQKNSLSISEIAFDTGFEDVSYFGRFFKKHTGISPAKYRNMIDPSY